MQLEDWRAHDEPSTFRVARAAQAEPIIRGASLAPTPSSSSANVLTACILTEQLTKPRPLEAAMTDVDDFLAEIHPRLVTELQALHSDVADDLTPVAAAGAEVLGPAGPQWLEGSPGVRPPSRTRRYRWLRTVRWPSTVPSPRDAGGGGDEPGPVVALPRRPTPSAGREGHPGMRRPRWATPGPGVPSVWCRGNWISSFEHLGRPERRQRWTSG